METLFPLHDEVHGLTCVSGLVYLPNYITEAQQRELVATIDLAEWDTSWDRRRQSYGAAYGQRQSDAKPIPAWGVALAERMHRERLCERPFDQMLVNEYLPGQGIAMHRDYDPFDRTVASLSLLAPCVMDFRHIEDGRREALLLEPRSLLVLHDEARYDWQHGIARRKSDRWLGERLPRARRLSVTFRSLKRPGS